MIRYRVVLPDSSIWSFGVSDGTGVGPLHRDVVALPFLFSVLLAFLGVDIFFFPKGTSMPGFEKNLS